MLAFITEYNNASIDYRIEWLTSVRVSQHKQIHQCSTFSYATVTVRSGYYAFNTLYAEIPAYQRWMKITLH